VNSPWIKHLPLSLHFWRSTCTWPTEIGCGALVGCKCFFFFNDTATTEIYTKTLTERYALAATHGPRGRAVLWQVKRRPCAKYFLVARAQ